MEYVLTSHLSGRLGGQEALELIVVWGSTLCSLSCSDCKDALFQADLSALLTFGKVSISIDVNL